MKYLAVLDNEISAWSANVVSLKIIWSLLYFWKFPKSTEKQKLYF